MSLISRAQAAESAVTDLFANGPGLFNRRARSAHDAIHQFVERALALPDHANLPPAERDELTTLIARTVEKIEAYIARPGERSQKRAAADQELVKAVYALNESAERVSQGKGFSV